MSIRIRALVTAVCLLFTVAKCSEAAPLYYVGESFGGNAQFGTVTAAGTKTVIGSGIPMSPDGNSKMQLLFAPDGTLYSFNVSTVGMGAGSHKWGTIDTTTGAFTSKGNLSTIFNFSPAAGEPPIFAFTSTGTLVAFGAVGIAHNAYGTINLTTGAFSNVLDFPSPDFSSLALGPSGDLFYVGRSFGSPAQFGKVTAGGAKTIIGSGIPISPDTQSEMQLLFAPDGTLYAFNVAQPLAGSHHWGTINSTTGVFTSKGNLSSTFMFSGFGLDDPPKFAFDSSGTLIAFGATGVAFNTFGTFNLTTGAFTSVLGAPSPDFASFALGPEPQVESVPEPGSIALLFAGFASFGGWRSLRRRK